MTRVRLVLEEGEVTVPPFCQLRWWMQTLLFLLLPSEIVKCKVQKRPRRGTRNTEGGNLRGGRMQSSRGLVRGE